jgi:hypothetical protein
MPASTSRITRRDPTTCSSEFARFGVGCRIGGAADCGLVVSEAGLLYLKEQLPRLPDQFSNARALRKGLASIAAMLKRVLVASRGA